MSLRTRDDWPKHQASVEFTFYLSQLDYELKMLIYRANAEPEDRALWEKYLALCVYEAMEKSVDPRRGRLLRASRLDPRFDEAHFTSAAKRYSEVVKEIKQDDGWQEIKRLRRFAAAHHGPSNAGGVDDLVDAQIAGWLTEQIGRTNLFNSSVVYCAWKFATAIQQFAADMLGAWRDVDPDATPDQAS